jgi:hypothetical protein
MKTELTSDPDHCMDEFGVAVAIVAFALVAIVGIVAVAVWSYSKQG